MFTKLCCNKYHLYHIHFKILWYNVNEQNQFSKWYPIILITYYYIFYFILKINVIKYNFKFKSSIKPSVLFIYFSTKEFVFMKICNVILFNQTNIIIWFYDVSTCIIIYFNSLSLYFQLNMLYSNRVC